MSRRRQLEMEGEVPMGEDRIPYDQTDPMVDVAAPPQATPEQTGPPPGGLLAPMGGGMQPAAAGPVGAGVEPPLNTDDLTGNDLAALGEPVDVGDPQDLEVQQMMAALDDPEVPEEAKLEIQQMLDLAARRRLAGSSGQPQGNPLLA